MKSKPHTWNPIFSFRASVQYEKNVTTTPHSELSYHLESYAGAKRCSSYCRRPFTGLFGAFFRYWPTDDALPWRPPSHQGPYLSSQWVLCHPTRRNWEFQVSTHIECTTYPRGAFFVKVTRKLLRTKRLLITQFLRRVLSNTPLKYDDSHPIASVLTKDLSILKMDPLQMVYKSSNIVGIYMYEESISYRENTQYRENT